jgi:hypothetical protein
MKVSHAIYRMLRAARQVLKLGIVDNHNSLFAIEVTKREEV